MHCADCRVPRAGVNPEARTKHAAPCRSWAFTSGQTRWSSRTGQTAPTGAARGCDAWIRSGEQWRWMNVGVSSLSGTANRAARRGASRPTWIRSLGIRPRCALNRPPPAVRVFEDHRHHRRALQQHTKGCHTSALPCRRFIFIFSPVSAAFWRPCPSSNFPPGSRIPPPRPPGQLPAIPSAQLLGSSRPSPGAAGSVRIRRF